MMSTKIRIVSESDVFEAIHQITHLYRGQQYKALRGSPQALGPIEFRVLHFIGFHPGCTLTDLVAHSGRDKGQMARLLRGLRDAELVSAEEDPADRRSTLLSLMPAGRALFDEVHAEGERLSRQAFAGFTQGDKALLQSLLARVQENLSSNTGER
ncbi:MarR family winged helix-turn-helix transcriptional regulator [Pseudoduganella violaceinigra]|uniref:MarR family winged helix-turn-helix transcriptional regulator n=1 Tax=Pseudoduganella violaceinigra TaxID=246602 RepID=UPI0003FB77E7|nr:MarR family winged helix-turn-helix transcriptional regulator [Pseudoduganella violaceinigra]